MSGFLDALGQGKAQGLQLSIQPGPGYGNLPENGGEENGFAPSFDDAAAPGA